MKKGPYGRFGVDVENGFDPYYIVSPDKKKTVAELKKALKEADTLYVATDEDREGEAIAWHLLETLKPKKSLPVKRMVFHESTKDAIRPALDSTRDIDASLVDAQETRRILDRLWASSSPRCCGGRSSRPCRPAVSSPSPPAWWSSASASGWRSSPPTTGTSPAPSPHRAVRTGRSSPRRSPPSTAPGSRPAPTSPTTAP